MGELRRGYLLGLGAYVDGRLPYIALWLAFSFAFYALVKKRVGLPAAEGLFVESAVLALPALGYLTWLQVAGHGTFGRVSAGHTARWSSPGRSPPCRCCCSPGRRTGYRCRGWAFCSTPPRSFSSAA